MPFSGTTHDELDRLQGKNLGDCAACGRPVFLERNFTRFRGRVVHVRCPIGTPAPVRALTGKGLGL